MIAQSAEAPRRTRSLLRRRWVIIGAWFVWGLLTTAQVLVSSRLAGRTPIPVLVALRLQMPLALLWALATPGIIWLGCRFPPFGGPRWPRGVAVNVVASMVAVAFRSVAC